MFQKDPTKESQPPSRDDAISALGGGPPVGWGIHEDEEHYWQEPIYRVHPLSNRLEAVGGLFHRFWVEHVEQLLQMKADGWPHEDILDVAEELRQRQLDAYEEQKKLVETGKEERAGLHQDNVAAAFNRFPQDEPIPELGKALAKSILRLEDVEKKAEALRKSYSHTLPKLPFSYKDLSPVFTEESLRLHHSVLHRGYVTKLNELVEGQPWKEWSPLSLLSRIDELPSHMRTGIEHYAGGHFNHCLLWLSLQKPKRKNKPSPAFEKLFNSRFNSFSNFKEHCKALLKYWKGSGWLWLVYSRETKGLKLYPLANQKNPFSCAEGDFPLLGIDLWEHAYLFEHGGNRAFYLNEFWKVVDWAVVERRFDVAFKVDMLKADPSIGGQRTLTPQEQQVQHQQSFSRRPQGVTGAATTPERENDEKEEAPTPVLIFTQPQGVSQ